MEIECPIIAPASGGFLENLFTPDFVPRAQCVGDRPEIIWLHVISDASIALAYYSIPLALIYFVSRRKDVAFGWMFVLFALFILACGTTHVLDAVAFWYPMYRFDGVVRAATGGISIVTAVTLWPLIPKALALPSPKEMRAANEALASSRAELERRVELRTAELEAANERLKVEIEERRATERELSDRRERMARKLAEIELIYRTAPVGLCLMDAKGEYIRINATMAALDDADPAECAGRPADEITPRLAEIVMPLVQEVIESGEARSNVEVAQAGDGQRWLASCHPLRLSEAGVVGVTVAVQDVSELARLHDRLRRSQQMEALGHLAGGIAHDFNNQLTAMFAYISQLQARLSAGHPASQPLERLREAAEHAGRTTRSVMRFVRRENPERAALEVRGLIEDALVVISGAMPAKVSVEADFEAAEGAWILAGPIDMNQALLNLAINARDAMPEGGTLRIWAAADATTVRLGVSDTGVGMDPEVSSRAVEPFFTTKPRGHGTGLGLTFVDTVVKAFGGRLLIESTRGRGTKVTIELPRAASPVRNTRAVPAPEPMTERGRLVLVADDTPAVREVLAAGLRASGFKVEEAQDGVAFLELREKVGDQAGLFVLDGDMPRLSGLDALLRLREAGDRTPAILVSGAPIEGVPDDGVTWTLAKPFTWKELGEAAKRAMGE